MSPCGSIKLGIHDTRRGHGGEQKQFTGNEFQFTKWEVPLMVAWNGRRTGMAFEEDIIGMTTTVSGSASAVNCVHATIPN
jgi:hypothetical protein